MIPFGIVSGQKLYRPAPPTVTLPGPIVMDFLAETYTVDGVAVDPTDLLNGFDPAFVTLDGLGDRTTSDILSAAGDLLTLLKYGLAEGLQVIVDWQLSDAGSPETELIGWDYIGGDGNGVFLQSLTDFGLDAYQLDPMDFDNYTGAGVGYNTSFTAINTIQRGGAFFNMLQSGYPSRRWHGVALNDTAAAQSYTETILNPELVSAVYIGGKPGFMNTTIYITRIEAAPLAFDYSQLADFSALTALP